MPNIGPMIAASAELGLGYAERLLNGITPDQFARLARIGDTVIESNHPAFIFGHLSLYGRNVIAGLDQDASAYQPSEEFIKVFSKDATCVDDPDGSIYPAMKEITTAFFDSYRAAIDALRQADDDLFTQPNPNEGMQAKFPTKGAMYGFYVGGHVMLHIGQLSAWRRAKGLGPA
ncbi:MAG: DinB family protein [Pirellulaceae bacterium]|nr:DinB family protein [Pirellulaceae bacterium]